MIQPNDDIDITLDELGEALYLQRHAHFDVDPVPWEEQDSTAFDMARARSLFQMLQRVQRDRAERTISRLLLEPVEPCFSRGPRIGSEDERPLCLRPNYHEGPHEGYEGSGFERERWGDPKMRDTMLVREWLAGERIYKASR